jgi:hypothetical protein
MNGRQVEPGNAFNLPLSIHCDHSKADFHLRTYSSVNCSGASRLAPLPGDLRAPSKGHASVPSPSPGLGAQGLVSAAVPVDEFRVTHSTQEVILQLYN